MTVQQLLTGVPGPLSNQEYVQWIAFTHVKKNREEQAQKRASRRGRRR